MASRGSKECPYCGELIKEAAVKCRYCGEFLYEDEADDLEPRRQRESDAAVRWLVPVERSGYAIAAGYCGQAR